MVVVVAGGGRWMDGSWGEIQTDKLSDDCVTEKGVFSTQFPFATRKRKL